MEFLKRILGRIFRLLAGNRNDGGDLSWLRQNRRLLRIESLESRELLSAVSPLAEFSGYASTLGETEIRFELVNNGSGTSKIEITLNSLQAAFDPSAIRLQATGGAAISLTNVFNTSVQSGGTALLAQGNYSVFFKADSGAGNFKLNISFVESTPLPNISAMTIIVEASKAQQMTGWDNMREVFNAALYGVAPEYGAAAFNGGKVINLFPEADVNKDGKLDNTDVNLAASIANENKTEPIPQVQIPSNNVIYPDKTPPAISATLITPAQNGITTNPAITGNISDQSGIKSAVYKINNGAEQQISLANNGTFTILNSNIAEGNYEITIIVTDNYGNITTSKIPAFTYQKTIIYPPPTTIGDDGNGTANINQNFVIAAIDGKDIAQNNQITLAENKGIITVDQNNITLNAGSEYDYLAQDEETFLTVSVQLVDIYGVSYTSEIEFTITGKNDTPTQNNNAILTKNLNEGESGIINVTEILGCWEDVDGDSLSIVNAAVESVEYSDNNLSSIFSKDFIEQFFSLDQQNGYFVFNATDSKFAQLAVGETITITINYQVSDGNAQNSGQAQFIVTGKESDIKLETEDDITEINAGYSNDKNTKKEIDFNFRYENPDAKNSPYSYTFSDVLVNNVKADDNLISDFNVNTGKFTIDTAKLSNREIDTTISITISISNDENVIIISRDLTVTLTALAPPSVADITVEVDESSDESLQQISDVKTSGLDGVEFRNLTIDKNDTQLSDYGIDDLGQIADLSNTGEFTFDPQEYFISLTGNESIILNLQYTITDKEHGNTGTGNISVKICGKATLPQNAGEPLTIGNSDNQNYDGTESIIVTKNEILAQWILPEADDNFAIAEIEDVSYFGGFDGESDFLENPFGEAIIGSAEIDDNGNIVFTPDANVVKKLSAGQWVEVEIKYSLQNIFDDPDNTKSGGSLIIRITGQNDAPEFTGTETSEFYVKDDETVEINWRDYFSDIDSNDTLKLTKIRDREFDQNGEIEIDNVGKFYFEDEKLKFSPAEKFASLQSNDTAILNFTFTVADSSGETVSGDFQITVTGTNKAPTAQDQVKTITNGESVTTFKLDEIEIVDPNEGDTHYIDKLEIKISDTVSITINKDDDVLIKNLDNGIIVTFNPDNNTVTIDSSARTKLPSDGMPENVEIIVTINDNFGASCTANWSAIITNKPPEINNNFSHTYIHKTDDSATYEINLQNNITDQNTPNRNGSDQLWYEVSDLQFGDNVIDKLKTALNETLMLGEDGILKFTPSEEFLDYLKNNLDEGKTIEIKLSYLVTDNLLKDANGKFVCSTGELTLKIYGKNAAVIEIDDSNFSANLADTNGDIEIINNVTISDPDIDSDYLDGETEYQVEIDYDSVEISGEQSDDFKQLNFTELFTIDNENNIKFTGNADTFKSLNADEELAFTFNILVTDQYGTVATQDVTFTVIGKGDPATVTTSDELTIFGNKCYENSEPISESFNVTYEIADPDMNEEHTFSFAGLFDGEDDKITLLDNTISVAETSGVVTINESFFTSEFLQNLKNENSTFKIKINVTGNIDELPTELELTFNINFAANPKVDNIDEQTIYANGKIENLEISVTNNDDGAERENPSYTYTQPQLDDSELLDEIKNQISADIDDNGIFSFDPSDIFDYLGVGESVDLTFNFSVRDNIYNVESTASITVTINGINETPQFKNDSPTFDAGQVTTDENNVDVQIDLAELFSDVDQNDKHKVVSINDVELTDEWRTIDGLGQFKYTDAEEDGFNGKLWYRAFVPEGETNELEKLSAKLTTLEFDNIVIQDNSGKNNNTANGTLKINVTGINSQPVIDKNPIDNPVEEDSISDDYLASNFVTDKNIDDEFIFDSINGTKISEPSENVETQTIILNDGTKIIVSTDRKSFKIDAASRYDNLAPDAIVLNNILVTIADNSQTENAISLPCAIQFKIKGINDKPKINDQHFGVNPDDLLDQNGKKYIGFVPITDADTDTQNYTYTIEHESENENGTPDFIVEKCENGAAIYIDESNIPPLAAGESVSYTFTIKAEYEAENVSANITVTFNKNEKPFVTFEENNANVIITENENAEDEIAAKEVIVKSEDGGEVEDYSYTNVRFVKGEITDNKNSLSTIYSLPQGVEFGFNDDTFYLKSNGKFDFLGEKENVVLTFEFTVFDETNKIGTTKIINVTINGKNSTPVANNIKADVDVPINNTDGYKFYINDLFTDADQNDSITEISINGTKFTLLQSVLDIYQNAIKYGTITFDSMNGCLIFKPDSDAPIRANETYLLKFGFSVTDSFNAKSNDGEIIIGLRGVNKPPAFKDNVTLYANEKEQLQINAEQLATDTNGDPLKIVAVRVGDETIKIGNSDSDQTIELASGAVLILTKSGQLIYDPTNRTNNLSINQTDTETFSLTIADEYENGSSNTDWKEFQITVEGVNDQPVEIQPNQTELIGNFKGNELIVKLSEYFDDPDNDILSYEVVDQVDDNSFIESYEIGQIDGEPCLAIKFRENIYSDSAKFDPAELKLKIKDNNGGEIEKTFIVKLPPTVEINIAAGEISEDETYNVTVTANDLINELLGYSYSNGFSSIKFSINIDPEFCDISDISSIGTVTNFGYAIFVEITAEQIAAMVNDPLNFVLLNFKVQPKSNGIATFSLGNNIEIFRNNNLIDESQIAH
ncbi:MAG: hypothetical protein LBT09_00910 [Planctomycetaceae bacterium]|jgi:VCBS repeat-containing protein|nr:hypothetical protein [Planctomycetaceae bacterium]